MPAKHRVKQYVENGLYHVYNRGVEKRRIFLDDQDYRAFLHLLKYYLSPSSKSEKHPLTEVASFIPIRPRPLITLHGEVDLLCYCLLPNHFHLLIKQLSEKGMERLLRRLLTTYSIYFNRRYNRVGHLFQGVYKAALIENDAYLLHLSRYIHQNPPLTKAYLREYPYSSYPNYLGEKKTEWLNPEVILSFFQKPKIAALKITDFTTYKGFVEGGKEEPKEILGGLIIEGD